MRIADFFFFWTAYEFARLWNHARIGVKRGASEALPYRRRWGWLLVVTLTLWWLYPWDM